MASADGGWEARLDRSGGRSPEDDEHLVVRADGRAEAWRTVAAARAGAFAGAAADEVVATLGLAAADPPASAEQVIPRDAALEVHRLSPSGAQLALGGSDEPPAAWAAAAGALRGALDAVTAHPVSAVELAMPGPDRAVLQRIGDGPPLAVGPVDAWRFELLDGDGLGRARRQLPQEDLPRLEGPGPWEVRLPDPWTPGPRELVRCWAEVQLEHTERGRVRARLVAVWRPA